MNASVPHAMPINYSIVIVANRDIPTTILLPGDLVSSSIPVSIDLPVVPGYKHSQPLQTSNKGSEFFSSG